MKKKHLVMVDYNGLQKILRLDDMKDLSFLGRILFFKKFENLKWINLIDYS